MDSTSQDINYILYARKSSESEDKQIQSIKDQIDRLKQLALDFNLNIIDIVSEAKSAKKPNIRSIFDAMIERIESGEANGILCWQINRLSRNPIDSGKISWLLQQQKLFSIRTIDREYKPEDNVLLLSVETGVANQFILDLSKNTKRGLARRLKEGWLPCLAPLGYLNTVTKPQGENYIVKDPKLFPLIRKMWDMVLTGSYSARQVLDIANNEWGLRTRKHKHKGGKPLSYSTIYRILNNPFYYGMFNYAGKVYQGSHEPMITIDEFNRVQELLGGENRAKPIKHIFPYAGMIRCGECGCQITVTKKVKYIKSLGRNKDLIYYHCTRKKQGVECNQNKYTPQDLLEKQIDKKLSKLTILPDFLKWALETLNDQNDREISDRTAIHKSLSQAVLAKQKEIDNLTQMRYRELIDDDEYSVNRNKLKKELANLISKRDQTEDRAKHWLELTEKTFNFATYARYHFNYGDLQTKKEILLALGQNLTLKDQKITIPTSKWLQPIEKKYKTLENKYLEVRTNKNLDKQTKRAYLQALYTEWGG